MPRSPADIVAEAVGRPPDYTTWKDGEQLAIWFRLPDGHHDEILPRLEWTDRFWSVTHDCDGAMLRDGKPWVPEVVPPEDAGLWTIRVVDRFVIDHPGPMDDLTHLMQSGG